MSLAPTLERARPLRSAPSAARSAANHFRSRALPRHRSVAPRWLGVAAVTAVALAACAVVVQRQTRRAEREHPPTGRFIEVEGVRLHFTVHGRDESPQTVVLLHGNGALEGEMQLSGLVGQLAQRYRVVAFDRPGYGHSERPHDRRWTPERQADLFHTALTRMGVVKPIVLGHSWGTLVALAMGLRHPDDVGSLVLACGYYYPSARVDWLLLSGPAWPGLGWLWRHTVSPLLGRLLWPLAVKRMFSPNEATDEFKERFPVWMALRPKQMRASAAEAAGMLPAALRLSPHYHELQVPTVLIAGARDRMASPRWHSARLHDELERSWLRIVEDTGHMVHHNATRQVATAVDQAAAMVWDRKALLRPPAGLKTGERAAGNEALATTLPPMPCAARMP